MLDGAELMGYIAELYPLTRSITGPGVRQSLDVLERIIPLERSEVPSGTRVLDWTVPDEWVFTEGWIEDADGKRLLDSSNSNLHVVNYSCAVDQTVSKAELDDHLFSLEDRPDAIPYRTSYYERSWGFCISDNQRKVMGDGPFRVHIDAKHVAGSLTYAEHVVRGTSTDEVLISTHICHPSLANDNLSGMVLAAALAQRLNMDEPRLTYRFLFVPGTIGAISWLANNRQSVSAITDGLVLTGLGDEAPYTWKQSRGGDNRIDRLVAQVLRSEGKTHEIVPFGPYGYDERQYGSPGFNLPVGRLTRGVHGTFPEYHTSGDNLEFVSEEGLAESLGLLLRICQMLDADQRYENLQPYGEPMLGQRGLYSSLGGLPSPGDAQMAMLWLLNQSDGTNSLLDVSEKSGLSLDELDPIAKLLVDHQLLRAVP